MTSNINQGGWYSKKSIMRDLARATGVRHIDDTCFVVGETPPPRRTYNEDVAEMMNLYGDLPENVPYVMQTPDLNGIQEMLRMVNNDTVDRSNSPTDQEESPCTDNILTISKLNPEVNEFLPASACTSASCVKQNGCLTMSNGDKKETAIDKDSMTGLQCNTKVEVGKDLRDVYSENKTNGHMPSDNIKEMREKLKAKISNNANTNSVKSKREKNLAMASLLKLCSQAPEGKSNVIPSRCNLKIDAEMSNKEPTKNNAALKLLPPDYYETYNNSNEIVNQVPILNKIMASTDKCVVDHKKNCASSTSHLNLCKTDYNTTTSMKVTETNVQSIVDEDIQNSVKKVESWLASVTSGEKTDGSPDKSTLKEEQPTTKNNLSIPKREKKPSGPPMLYLGPVTFKRKEVVKSNSPSITSESTARNTPSIQAFVPSAYASELSRTYNERAEAKKVIEDDIWTKLYTELDKRDEAYRRKVAEAAAVSTSLSDAV